MKRTHFFAIAAAALLSGCAGMTPPPADELAALPVVTYPAKPPAGDYVYRLPAGEPIDMRILVDGTALAAGVDRNVSASLARDLWLHKQWASEDGRNWRRADQVIGVKLTVHLPSYETPGPGEMHLTVDNTE